MSSSPPPQLQKGILEIGVARDEAAALIPGPDMIRLKAQSFLELDKALRPSEPCPVKLCLGEGLHKFIVGRHPRALRPDGNHADDVGGDGGRAVDSQDTDSLVPFLNVKVAEVLIAPDGVSDVPVPQVDLAQGHPLPGEFHVRVQQGQEVRRESGPAARRLGAYNLVAGNLHDSQLRLARHHGVADDLVQHLGIGVTAPDQGLLYRLCGPASGCRRTMRLLPEGSCGYPP